MDHVFVKVKGRAKERHFKLISNHKLYDAISIDHTRLVEYNPDHNLDEDDWFKIKEFSMQSYSIDFLKSNFDSKDYNDLEKNKFNDIVYLFSFQGGDFYFQKITPSLYLKRKMIFFGEVAKVEENNTRLVIKTTPDAVYFKTSDTLIFKNLSTISSIFKGIDELYKEATNDEVTAFLNEPFIDVSEDYGLGKVSKPNRKRIALVTASLDGMSSLDKASIPDYINEYCDQKLTFDDKNNTFKISTDEQLKLLLYGIEQRFYTTPLGGEKRLANSVEVL